VPHNQVRGATDRCPGAGRTTEVRFSTLTKSFGRSSRADQPAERSHCQTSGGRGSAVSSMCWGTVIRAARRGLPVPLQDAGWHRQPRRGSTPRIARDGSHCRDSWSGAV